MILIALSPGLDELAQSLEIAAGKLTPFSLVKLRLLPPDLSAALLLYQLRENDYLDIDRVVIWVDSITPAALERYQTVIGFVAQHQYPTILTSRLTFETVEFLSLAQRAEGLIGHVFSVSSFPETVGTEFETLLKLFDSGLFGRYEFDRTGLIIPSQRKEFATHVF